MEISWCFKSSSNSSINNSKNNNNNKITIQQKPKLLLEDTNKLYERLRLYLIDLRLELSNGEGNGNDKTMQK